MFQVPTVLFVGTGNTRRSRFAEALFNHHAEKASLGWCAFSRGLRPGSTDGDDLSSETTQALAARDIDRHHTAVSMNPLTAEDLEMAHIIIAISQAEHQPLVADLFPDWLDQCNFWDAPDHARENPEDAFPIIERETRALLADLAAAGQD